MTSSRVLVRRRQLRSRVARNDRCILASQEQMAASAIAMFKSANNLAFSSSVVPRAAAIICAMLFQWPGGVSVPAP